MRRLVTLCLLGILLLMPGRTTAQAAPLPHWKDCTIHLDWSTMSKVTEKTCHRYLINHPPGAVTGHTVRTIWRSPHVREWVKYPTFSIPVTQETNPVLRTEWVHVTGYSYTPACGDVNGKTADGSIPIPYFTIASSDRALWHHHVSVPSVGFSGYVQDTGAPLDLFMPSCQATLAVTGYREIYVYP